MVKEVCREYGVSDVTYYNWKAKYGGLESSDITRLKHMYAELSLDYMILKDIVEKSCRVDEIRFFKPESINCSS